MLFSYLGLDLIYLDHYNNIKWNCNKYDSVKEKSIKSFLYEVQIHYCYQVQIRASKRSFESKINDKETFNLR